MGKIKNFLGKISQPSYILFFLFILQLFFTWIIPFYISDGLLVGGDHPTHLRHISDVIENQDLVFTNKWYRQGAVYDYSPLFRILFASFFLITGINDVIGRIIFSPLFTALVLALGIFVIYKIGILIFESKKIALLSTLFYALSTSISIYLVQLPPNAIGIFFGLILIWTILKFKDDLDNNQPLSYKKTSIILIFCLALFYLHYLSTVVFLMFFSFPMIFFLVRRNNFEKFLKLIPFVFGCLALFIIPFFIWQRRLNETVNKLSLSTGTTGGLSGYESVSSVFAHLIYFGEITPHRLQSADFIFYCIGWLLFGLAVLGCFFYIRNRKKYPLLLLPVIWFLFLALAVFGHKTKIYFIAGWRYPNFWFIPMVFLAGFALFEILNFFNRKLYKFLVIGSIIVLLVIMNYSKVSVERNSKNTWEDIGDIQKIADFTNENDVVITWQTNGSLVNYFANRKLAFFGNERTEEELVCAYDLIRGLPRDDRRIECLKFFGARYIFLTKPPLKKYWMNMEVYKAVGQERIDCAKRSKVLDIVFETDRSLFLRLKEGY